MGWKYKGYKKQQEVNKEVHQYLEDIELSQSFHEEFIKSLREGNFFNCTIVTNPVAGHTVANHMVGGDFPRLPYLLCIYSFQYRIESSKNSLREETIFNKGKYKAFKKLLDNMMKKFKTHYNLRGMYYEIKKDYFHEQYSIDIKAQIGEEEYEKDIFRHSRSKKVGLWDLKTNEMKTTFKQFLLESDKHYVKSEFIFGVEPSLLYGLLRVDGTIENKIGLLTDDDEIYVVDDENDFKIYLSNGVYIAGFNGGGYLILSNMTFYDDEGLYAKFKDEEIKNVYEAIDAAKKVAQDAYVPILLNRRIKQNFTKKYYPYKLGVSYNDKINTQEMEAKIREFLKDNLDKYDAVEYILTPRLKKEFEYLKRGNNSGLMDIVNENIKLFEKNTTIPPLDDKIKEVFNRVVPKYMMNGISVWKHEIMGYIENYRDYGEDVYVCDVTVRCENTGKAGMFYVDNVSIHLGVFQKMEDEIIIELTKIDEVENVITAISNDKNNSVVFRLYLKKDLVRGIKSNLWNFNDFVKKENQ